MSYSASTTAGSGERIAAIGDLELCYETFGNGSDPALVEMRGMDHDLPRDVWPQIIDAFAADAACGTDDA